MSDLMKERVTVVCPGCGSTFNVRLRDVKNEAIVTCPRGHAVQLVDEDDSARHLDREMNKFDQEVKQVQRNMDRQFRKLKRKLR